jgi:hypothetical protein
MEVNYGPNVKLLCEARIQPGNPIMVNPFFYRGY